ncbi:MAG: hypothetical protein AAF702_14935 [Chloroflexota bacterium]
MDILAFLLISSSGLLGLMCLGAALMVKIIAAVAHSYGEAERESLENGQSSSQVGGCITNAMSVTLVSIALFLFMVATVMSQYMA